MLWHGTLLGMFAMLVAGGVGVPFPEDLTLIGAGVLVRQGMVALPEMIAVGLAGVMAGDWLVYLAGRRYGAEMARHPRLARLFGAARIDAVRTTVERHGMRAVFLGRFVLGFRIITFLAAGTFGVPAARFALAEAAGTAIFVPAMVTLGYLFADRALRILHDVGRVEHWLLLAGVVGLALYLVLRARAATQLIGPAPPPGAGAIPPRPPPPPDPPS